MRKPRHASTLLPEDRGAPGSEEAGQDRIFGSRRLSTALHPVSLSFALVGLLLTTFAASALYRSQKQTLSSQFQANLVSVHQMLETQLADLEHLLTAGKAFFLASGGSGTDATERDAWASIFRDLAASDRYPGIRGIGYAPLVPEPQRETFESSLRDAGLSGISFQLSGKQPFYAPVLLYEAFPENQKTATSFDLMAEKAFGLTLARARDSGQVSVSTVAPLRSVFGTGKSSVFLVSLPVYKEHYETDTVANRRAALRGYLFAMVEVDKFLAVAVEESNSGIGLSIRDSSVPDHDRPLFASCDTKVSSSFRANMDLYLGGHRWTIEAFSLAAFEDWISRLSSLFIALSGVAISLVGMVILADSKTKQERAARIARKKSESLRRSEAEVRALNSGLETAVAERTASLEEANQELRAFSYTVSHDLRAPVRHVQSLTALLEEEHHREFSSDARDYLSRIHEAADRMHRLIEEILRLASCSKVALRPQEIDLSAMSSEIVEELSSRHPLIAVQVTIQPDMTLTGDPAVVRTVMQNLLDNAFKFSSKSEHPEISVSATEGARGRVISVSDNGIGFDMAQAEIVFQPFKRLHRESDYEGNGVGLATVRKMVRRHGGEIEVESEPGAGTTFRFTLDGSRCTVDTPAAEAPAGSRETTLPDSPAASPGKLSLAR